MNNPVGLLARMFRRAETPNTVIASLFTQAIGRPLMVHPGLGEQLIDAYMRGAVDTRMDGGGMIVDMNGKPEATGSRIAVINVSGPLVDRPQPGLCDDGPLSYESIRESFDMAMEDATIGAVMFRMRSPGGMVDGCFDLTDHINASRGSKPIVAVVDNMAYSACYALAAACDEIWISRTGGVGSVGVVAYHVDQTAYDAKEGIKVTFMHAGSKKVDFSPHVALSKEAYDAEMEVINEMYGMFTTAVADYRGIAVDSVVATQAGTYHGQAAIDIGFATHLGTFRDAIASIALGMIASEEKPSDVAGASAETDPVNEGLTRDELASVDVIKEASENKPSPVADFIALVAVSNLPSDLSIALIKRGAKGQTPNAAIQYATDMRDMCAAAGLESCAIDYVSNDTPIDVARKQLLEAKAEDGPEIITNIPASATEKIADFGNIYSRRRDAAAGSASTQRQ